MTPRVSLLGLNMECPRRSILSTVPVVLQNAASLDRPVLDLSMEVDPPLSVSELPVAPAPSSLMARGLPGTQMKPPFLFPLAPMRQGVVGTSRVSLWQKPTIIVESQLIGDCRPEARGPLRGLALWRDKLVNPAIAPLVSTVGGGGSAEVGIVRRGIHSGI